MSYLINTFVTIGQLQARTYSENKETELYRAGKQELKENGAKLEGTRTKAEPEEGRSQVEPKKGADRGPEVCDGSRVTILGTPYTP